jgi:hypothetical protein
LAGNAEGNTLAEVRLKPVFVLTQPTVYNFSNVEATVIVGSPVVSRYLSCTRRDRPTRSISTTSLIAGFLCGLNRNKFGNGTYPALSGQGMGMDGD